MDGRNWTAIVIAAILAVTVAAWVSREWIIAQIFRPTESSIDAQPVDDDVVQVVKDGLSTPWAIVFLPDGTRVVSERGGQIRVGDSQQPIVVDGVVERGEGGLLGLAIHPDFHDNGRLYLYYTTEVSGSTINRVEAATLRNNELIDRRTILDEIPGAANHNGGAIEFGPDGKLYVANGDAGDTRLPQDRESLAGKILRMNDDGSVPDDNPFNSLVWSYGHRNPQGLAWDSDGRLWSVEHGPQANDELNLIERGGNYGWPEITGSEARDGMRTPIVTSGGDETWAPSRLVYAGGKLYFTGLRGQSLYQGTIEGEAVTLKRLFSSEYGRLRAIAAQDGDLYIGTSNRDGRGRPADNDDRILKVTIDQLQRVD